MSQFQLRRVEHAQRGCIGCDFSGFLAAGEAARRRMDYNSDGAIARHLDAANCIYKTLVGCSDLP
ncbi:hypothetical protein [Xanthomonas hortorum]|uniref:hypothetical protein n=1 Tax=Xanthomonas hortorum TaxID=56454 RepID=UPI000ACCAAAA|nr:hypothetical protein [Xanthomonas hortorum]MCC8663015.1 hypothetical protein [Xanthomonas hortorum pv. gardneri]MCC8708714.1 hypothetical protein [Xanthomonas hortorum pv. gardneri]MCC8717331.1 hypothetical protein [Xanthomonas hortorum pv. gardneri]MCC8721676.1 hypothetical protein [Xanthomonas hortorum pv. gardneri]